MALADLIVLGGAAAIEQADEQAVVSVQVPFAADRANFHTAPPCCGWRIFDTMPVTHGRRADWPCAVSSATAFLSKETKVVPPSQLPS